MKIIAQNQMNLLQILALLSPDSSKTTLRSWLELGRVSVDGKVAKRGDLPILEGQTIEVGKKAHVIRHDIKILFEDLHLVVIEKPEGLLSVATDFDKSVNAHTILKDRVHPRRVYPVHRLDRETSGIMVFAYSEAAREGLKEQFFYHTIEREYHALVEGKLEPADGSTRGTWKSLLKEDLMYRVSSHPHQGREAITHYEIVKYTRQLTLVRFILETGRKNQIRVHCHDAKHPIFGDIKYGSVMEGFPRLCLHASRLVFIHPETKKQLSFTSRIPF